MKAGYIFLVALVVIFCCASGSVADNWKDESGNGRKGKHKYKHADSDYKERPDSHGRRDFKKRPDYHKHHGYSKRPHDKGRHCERYDHKGHRYDYHGHWSSWEKWEKYAKEHPQFHKNGHYYRENAHLMFRFCEPGTENCLFFSIGK